MNSIEIRELPNGNIELKGLLPVNALSDMMFSKEKQTFFKETIKLGALIKS